MTRFVKFSFILLLLCSCHSGFHVNEKNIDEIQIIKELLLALENQSKIDNYSLRYLLVKKDFEDREIPFEDEILKELNCDYLGKNHVSEINNLSYEEIKITFNLIKLDEEEMEKKIGLNKFYGHPKDRRDFYLTNYEKVFKDSYINIQFIYFNNNKTKSIIVYHLGPCGSTLCQLFIKNKDKWESNKVIYYGL
jgi:hypothetical protein